MDAETKRRAAVALDVSGVQEINEGGQKWVARCVMRGGDRAVMKVIELNPAGGDTLERARREVGLLGRVDHPNVVKLLSPLQEVGSPPTAVAWLEEEVDGRDLRAAFATGRQWDEADTRLMLLDVARGLSAMHAEKVVHRDLSPGNVMRRNDGSYTVIDPGFGRHLERSTVTGMFQPGTPGYMTPEHAGARVILSSDVFAAGVLGYQALTATLPIPVRSPFDGYLLALRDDQAPSVTLARPDVTGDFAAVIDRCLQRQSGRRFLDASDLATAIEAL